VQMALIVYETYKMRRDEKYEIASGPRLVHGAGRRLA